MTHTCNLSAPVSPAPGSGLSALFARTGTVDTGMLVLLRCVPAFSGLVVVWLVLSDSRQWAAWIYGSFAIYCVFSIYLAYDSYRSDWLVLLKESNNPWNPRFGVNHVNGFNLLLQIGNETSAGAPDAGEFMPRSISERAQALKGKTFVERRTDHYTVVHVTIPT